MDLNNLNSQLATWLACGNWANLLPNARSSCRSQSKANLRILLIAPSFLFLNKPNIWESTYISKNLKSAFHCQKITVEALKVNLKALKVFFETFQLNRMIFWSKFLLLLWPKSRINSTERIRFSNWCPSVQKHINLIKRVQKSYSYRIPDLRESYPERLKS